MTDVNIGMNVMVVNNNHAHYLSLFDGVDGRVVGIYTGKSPYADVEFSKKIVYGPISSKTYPICLKDLEQAIDASEVV